MSFTFSDQQRKTLELICETINPDLQPVHESDQEAVFHNHAGLYPIVEQLESKLASTTEAKQKSIVALLRLINIPLVCWFWTHSFIPFRFLRLNRRVQILSYWRDHRNGKMRSFFQLIKRLTLFISYTTPAINDRGAANTNRTWPANTNRTWPAIDYEGRTPLIAQPETAISFRKAKIANYAEEVECDYLVIGSGAGGGVMAAELAERGYRILIAEKGELVAPKDLGNSEYQGISRYYEDGGSQATEDLGVTVLSGATVGGGTTVNWMTCLDPPQEIMHLWANQFGFADVLSDRFKSSLYAVRQRINVNDQHSQLNPQNEKLHRGCKHFGFRHQRIQRNATDCGDCGFCGFGCRSGSKQDTRQTYLADAMRLGAELLPQCKVDRIVKEGSVASHAIAHFKNDDGEQQEIKIKFRAAVVACGAVQSAALLLRSGFRNPHIGQNLKLHPTTAIAAFYDDAVYPWRGAPQTVVCDEFANLDGQQHGVRLEVAPCHPGFGAMAMAWKDPTHHKRLTQNLSRMANTIVIARDSGSGRVILNELGQPEIHYRLNNHDANHLLFGAERAVEIHRAAGAAQILGPHQQCFEFDRRMNERQFNESLFRMTQLGGDPNRLSLFSAHQMSTVRIADSPLRGALDRKGRCYDAMNVYVCDASVFPTSIGVNPMLTVMAISHMLAQRIRDEGFSVYDF